MLAHMILLELIDGERPSKSLMGSENHNKINREKIYEKVIHNTTSDIYIFNF